MDSKQELTPELRNTLLKWAEEQLMNIGVFKDKAPEFDRWREKIIADLRSVYSDKAIDIFLRTEDNRKMDDADVYAIVSGSCEDTMEMYLKLDDDRIIDASFRTDGCKGSIAAGGIVTELIKGKRINEIKKLTPMDALNALGGLPEENTHCASLAIHTLKEALEKLIVKEKK